MPPEPAMSDYGKPTAPRPDGQRGSPPPPWPSSGDPRTSRCTHGWSEKWGQVGERQRQCRHCRRWIWDHDLPAGVA